MTPMIDVVFLLLIFFVFTASFQIAESILPSNLQVPGSLADLPPIEESEPELERVLIGVTYENDQTRYTVGGRPCESAARLGEVLHGLAAIDPTLPVVLDIEGNVPLGGAVAAYDQCRLAGFGRIQFAVLDKVLD